MYGKGENLYNFERERFMFLKKWIDESNINLRAKEIMQEAQAIVDKYSVDDFSEYVCYKDMLSALATLSRKANNF